MKNLPPFQEPAIVPLWLWYGNVQQTAIESAPAVACEREGNANLGIHIEEPGRFCTQSPKVRNYWYCLVFLTSNGPSVCNTMRPPPHYGRLSVKRQ
jgi:hypothetical protein